MTSSVINRRHMSGRWVLGVDDMSCGIMCEVGRRTDVISEKKLLRLWRRGDIVRLRICEMLCDARKCCLDRREIGKRSMSGLRKFTIWCRFGAVLDPVCFCTVRFFELRRRIT